MNALKISFAGLLLVLTALWLLADTFIPEPFTYFSFRSVFIQYTGVIAICAMSVAMILTLRSTWMEKQLHGLDKMYRLHKWLGITALVTSILHWWWATGTKWMVGWGWLAKPARKPSDPQSLPFLEQLFRDQRHLAESVGEWAFYAATVLIVLALIKRFPYHLFRKVHNWLAVAYLVLAFHTLILTKFSYWLQPIGIIIALLLMGGTLSAILVMTGRVGQGRKAQGVVDSLTYYPSLRIIECTIDVNRDWQGHMPGQFAFVTSKKREGAHPYTIASAWDDKEHKLTFITKELGDWTSRLRDWLKVGLPVTIEGPYGCFNFSDSNPQQIWVGAGIGITPFIARMKYLAKVPGTQQIDLFHATSDFDQTAMDKLSADAKAAGVHLHLILTPQDGRLTPEKIRQAVPNWQSASIWYCGPALLGQTLRKDFQAKGIPSKNFHQELFDMR